MTTPDELDPRVDEVEQALLGELARQGEAGPVRDDDLAAAQATLEKFRAARRPRSRRLLVAVSSGALAAAAAAALWIALPSFQHATTYDEITVTRGSLSLDQAELETGEPLPLGRWIDASDEACVGHRGSTSCVAAGSRMRAGEAGLEFSYGELKFDGEGRLLTPFGLLKTVSGSYEVVKWDDVMAIRVTSGSVSIDGEVIEAGQEKRFGEATSLPPAEEEVPVVEPTKPTTEVADARRKKERRVERSTAGELLAAARKLVAAGDTKGALAAYRRLQRAHPRSPEARGRQRLGGRAAAAPRQGQARAQGLRRVSVRGWRGARRGGLVGQGPRVSSARAERQA